MKPVILDTGPVVAWLCPRDQHNAWVRRAFKNIAPSTARRKFVSLEVGQVSILFFSPSIHFGYFAGGR